MSDYAENAIDATIAHQPSPGERFYPAFEVTPELDAAASEYVTHYPEGKQKSAVLPILHEIQKKFGFISGDAIAWVGEKLNISAAHVLGIAALQDHIVVLYHADLVFHSHSHDPPFRMGDYDLLHPKISGRLHHCEGFLR